MQQTKSGAVDGEDPISLIETDPAWLSSRVILLADDVVCPIRVLLHPEWVLWMHEKRRLIHSLQ